MTKKKQYISWAQVDVAVREIAERLSRIVEMYDNKGISVDIGPPVDEDPAHAIVAGMLAHHMRLPYDGAGGAKIVVCAEPKWRDGEPLVGSNVNCWTFKTMMSSEQYECGAAAALFWTIDEDPQYTIVHALCPLAEIVWPWEQCK